MQDAREALKSVGFGEYEAAAYCALLAESPANGYQVSRRSGIPRAKVYECLERLVARGAAQPVQTSARGARTYAPTDPETLMKAMQETVLSSFGTARGALKRIQSDARFVEVLWRVASKRDLIERGRTIARNADSTLHVALWSGEFGAILDDLVAAAERGVRMALILYDQHEGLNRLQEMGVGAVPHSLSKRKAVSSMGRQFVLVADYEQSIIGSVFAGDDVEGVYTMNRGLVTNAVDLVNHEIYVERMVREVGKPISDRYGRYLDGLDAFGCPVDAAAGGEP